VNQSIRIADLLRQIRKQLRDSSSPELDARLLVRHVVGCSAPELILREQQPVTTEQLESLCTLVKWRKQGQPIAYILGRQAFWDMQLTVCKGVLVPRADTEVLVEASLDLPHNNRPWQVAELGTGSGAIALALARERPQWWILATDISPLALQVAQQNARDHAIYNIQFCRSNWCRAIRPVSLDMLLSNPPYIVEKDPHLRGDGVRYEPRRALVAGPDGLDAIRIIIASARDRLRPGGWLLLEHGAEQAQAVCDLMTAQSFLQIRTITDLAGNPRVSGGRTYITH